MRVTAIMVLFVAILGISPVLAQDKPADNMQILEKGTGYFSEPLRGRPRLRKVDSRPMAFAILTCQSELPKGAWRFTLVRMRAKSDSAMDSSSHRLQSEGGAKGHGSTILDCRILDQGHWSARLTKYARTGLSNT